METTNKRVDNVVKDVTEYKQSLDYTQVVDQKKTSDQIATICRDAQRVCESALSLDGIIDYFEGQSKRNIITDSISESLCESWDTEDKLHQILVEKLEIDQVEMEQTHRTGDPTTAGDRQTDCRQVFKMEG